MSRFDTVQVHVDLEHSGHPVLMGELHCQQSRSGEIFSFNYDDTWLARPEVFAFDPDLALSAGHQYPAPDKVNFGIFLDSSPDRYVLTKEQTAKVHQQVQVRSRPGGKRRVDCAFQGTSRISWRRHSNTEPPKERSRGPGRCDSAVGEGRGAATGAVEVVVVISLLSSATIPSNSTP